MKVLISSDLEGISCVDDYRQIFPLYGKPYEKACTHLAEDINAAIRGLRLAGATEIDVVDGHSRGEPPNIVREKIESAGRVIPGFEAWSRSKPFPLDNYDAQVLVGYHAMAGTLDGFLSHTISGITAIKMNGQYVGETEISAYGAGFYDVPTILVTGDAAVVREAKSFLPRIEGAVVKTASRRDTVKCLPPEEARKLISKVATHSLSNLKSFKPFRLSTPILLEVVFASPDHANLAAAMPRAKLSGDRTVSYVAEEFREAMAAFSTALSLAMANRQRLLSQRLQKSEDAKRIMEGWLKEVYRRWATELPPFQPVTY